MGKKNSDYVCIQKDKYDVLIECRMHIDMLHKYITNEHTASIRLRGCKQATTDMKTIELLSGYMENERYFIGLIKEFKNRRITKCE